MEVVKKKHWVSLMVLSRFCRNCADFDLCSSCEATSHGHNDDHVFIKIIRPVALAGRRADGKLMPLLVNNLYKEEEEQLSKRLEKCSLDEREHVWASFKSGYKQAKKMEKLRRKAEKLSQKTERIRSKEEKLKRRFEQERDLPLLQKKKEKLSLPQYHPPE